MTELKPAAPADSALRVGDRMLLSVAFVELVAGVDPIAVVVKSIETQPDGTKLLRLSNAPRQAPENPDA